MTYIRAKPGVSTGTIIPYGAASAPTGYLLCNGTAVSRTTYSALFAIIGTAYGVGDGSTTFNVPDMRGNVPVGKGGSDVAEIGDAGGEQTHTLVTGEIPSHTHGYAGVTHDKVGDTYGGNAGPTSAKTSDATGGGGAHENMQPYVGTEYIIKT